MNIWSPDTCQCIIEINNETFIDYIQKCQIHKNFNDQDLLDRILFHNRGFKANGTRIDIKNKQAEKATERKRILDIGDPIRNV